MADFHSKNDDDFSESEDGANNDHVENQNEPSVIAMQFLETKFEGMWQSIAENVKPVLSGKSQRKRKVMTRLKISLERKIKRLLGKEKTLEELLKNIEEDLNNRFRTIMNLSCHNPAIPAIPTEVHEMPKDDNIRVDDDNESMISGIEPINPEEVTVGCKRKNWDENLTEKLKSQLNETNRRLAHIRNENHKLRNLNIHLREKTQSMLLRNAEFTRQKMIDQMGMRRSTVLVDASLFAERYHGGDPLLQEQNPQILDSSFVSKMEIVPFRNGHFAETKKACFPDGSAVILKHYLKNKDIDLKNLAFVSHEHRILKFIGDHPNLVKTVGIVHIFDSFYSVLDYVGEQSLSSLYKDEKCKSQIFFENVLGGVAEGLNCLHDKGVLHNHLTSDNIHLIHDVPVIIGFSFACRSSCVRGTTSDVLKKFDDHRHLAPELYKGIPVSYASDLYSFGVILKDMLKPNKFSLSDTLKDRSYWFSVQCKDVRVGHRPPHMFFSRKVHRLISLG